MASATTRPRLYQPKARSPVLLMRTLRMSKSDPPSISSCGKEGKCKLDARLLAKQAVVLAKDARVRSIDLSTSCRPPPTHTHPPPCKHTHCTTTITTHQGEIRLPNRHHPPTDPPTHHYHHHQSPTHNEL